MQHTFNKSDFLVKSVSWIDTQQFLPHHYHFLKFWQCYIFCWCCLRELFHFDSCWIICEISRKNHYAFSWKAVMRKVPEQKLLTVIFQWERRTFTGTAHLSSWKPKFLLRPHWALLEPTLVFTDTVQYFSGLSIWPMITTILSLGNH